MKTLIQAAAVTPFASSVELSPRRLCRSAPFGFACIALASLLPAAPPCFAVDRLVPSQYTSIQAAVNASANGDRVLISPGLYRESVRFLGKSVMLEGPSPQLASSVQISGVGVAGPPVFVADSTAYVGTVGLRNLTITSEGVLESGQDAGAIFSYLGPAAEVLVENCIFRDVRSGTGIGAIYLGHTACTIRRCVFMRNTSTVHGVAIYAYDGVNAVVEDSYFVDHTFGTGTFYSRVGANVQVRNCVIRNSNALCAHFQNGIVTFSGNIGCSIGVLSNGGYVDGGGNNWAGPCPDCDGDGIADLEEAIFHGGDCDGDLDVDACEIASDPSIDRNRDGIIDQCQCIGDIFADAQINGADLGALLSYWGPVTGSGPSAACDLDGNGVVNGADLGYLLANWGVCP